SEDQSNSENYQNYLSNSVPDIIVLPNPSKEEIVLVSHNDEIDQKNINIYSVDGKLVKTIQNYFLGNNIIISELSTGLYSLVVHSNGGETTVVRFFKE
ncbi:MAG: T9SS type A sorting domain-containing protein, partial [Crocinitomicaceae bacterium]